MTSSNARSQPSVQQVAFVPFSVRKKGLSLSIKWAMKRPNTTKRPVRYCNSFLLPRADVSKTALIWSGLTSIPLYVTINPRNLPMLTLKTHLAGLNFMLYALIKRNVSSKCWACSLRVLLFTTMLSMQTSTVQPIRGLKIFVINL